MKCHLQKIQAIFNWNFEKWTKLFMYDMNGWNWKMKVKNAVFKRVTPIKTSLHISLRNHLNQKNLIKNKFSHSSVTEFSMVHVRWPKNEITAVVTSGPILQAAKFYMINAFWGPHLWWCFSFDYNIFQVRFSIPDIHIKHEGICIFFGVSIENGLNSL